jgi:co-chaperonin GroES (HSP10)
MKHAFEPHRIKSLHALHDHVIVHEMEFSGRQLSSGIILMNDNGTTAGIRPRWGQVYAVGPKQQDVKVGQWVCVAHGRWTRGLDIQDDTGKKTIRRIDPADILLVSDQPPGADDTLSDAIQASAKDRFS